MRTTLLIATAVALSCTGLRAQAVVVSTQPADAPAATQPGQEAIRARFQKAKEVYDGDVDSARKRLLAYFAARGDSAQKQGDLQAMKTYAAMKQAFATDGTLPQEGVDVGMRDNINNYTFSLRVATRNLSSAYTAAVKDYTRAGMIAEADAMQAEADAFQKTSIGPPPVATATPAPAPANVPAVPLGNGRPLVLTKTSGLPQLFEPNADVQLTDGGLVFPSMTYLRTKRSDFVNLDFTLDVLVNLKAKEQLRIGIGPALPGKTMMAGIQLTTGGMALDEYVGELGKVGTGTHLFHLEKHGVELTAAIVLNYHGKMEPDYKRTASLRGMRWLTAENAHLYIAATGDGVAIKELRISQ